MKKEKFYWRVCYKNSDGEFISAIITDGKYCVHYEIGKRVKSPMNGIYVLKTRKLAREFRKFFGSSNLFVFKCRVFGDEILNQPLYSSVYLYYDGLVVVDGKEPAGTHFFPEIELVSKEH